MTIMSRNVAAFELRKQTVHVKTFRVEIVGKASVEIQSDWYFRFCVKRNLDLFPLERKQFN